MTDTVSDIRSRLVQFQGRYPEIARVHGFSYSWLSKFARGDRGARPSFETVSKLKAALEKLEAERDAVAAPAAEVVVEQG